MQIGGGYINGTAIARIYDKGQLVFEGGTPLPSEDLLMKPLSSDILSKGQSAYGFDLLVQGYAGNTVRLKRLSDNVEADFGFDADGIFNLAGVHTWRSGANVDVVKFYDQIGSAITLDAVNKVTFVVSDVVERFGTIWGNYTVSATKTSGSSVVTVASTTLMAVGMLVTGVGIPTNTVIESVDSGTQITLSQNATVSETSNIVIRNGLLTRDNTKGAVGCNTGVNRGYFRTSTNLTFTPSTGLEVHMLWSPNKRKRQSVASSQYGGDTTTEYLFAYGFSNNAYFRVQVISGSSVYNTRLKTSTADTSTTQASGGVLMKQYSQQVLSFAYSTSRLGSYSTAAKETDIALAGTSNPADGGLNNGRLYVGTAFTFSGDGSVQTTSTSDMLFGGVILTTPLTDLERWMLLQKLTAIGQQHYAMATDDLLDLFDDVVVHSEINTTTGNVAGRKNTCNFSFNLPTLASPTGTPDFTPSYTMPNLGLVGLRSGADNDNAYISNDATPPDLRGTVISLNMTENSGNVVFSDFCVTSNLVNEYSTNFAEMSFGSGRDHGQPSAVVMLAASRQGGSKPIGNRFYADRTTQFGSAVYDGSNQMHGKYNRSVGCVVTTYGETITSLVRSAASWMNQGANSLGLDGPVLAQIPENTSVLSKDAKLTLQITRFNAPVGYNKGDDWATRLPLTLQSDNWHFVGQGAPLGHIDGSIAHNPFGGVVDHGAGAKFKSLHGLQQSFEGVRILWAWTPTVLTDEQVNRVAMNLYKLLN